MAFPPLMDQQAAASAFIQQRPFVGCFLDMSGGKTMAVLHALSQVQPTGHILVIAPVKIARLSWSDEIAKWDINVRVRSLIVNEKDKKLTPRQRHERYAETIDPSTPPTLWLINRELLMDLITWLPRLNLSDRKKIPTPVWPFPTVIIDESQGFKNPSSQRFKAIKAVRPQISRMILLSGTPAPNGLQDLWAQVYLLDQGQALGPTMTEYLHRYFRPKFKIANGTPVGWTPNEGSDALIHERISHLVMSAPTVARTPMPEMVIHEELIDMPEDAMSVYKDLAKHLIVDFIQEQGIDPQAQPQEALASVSAANNAVLRNKLTQLASGTIYLDTDPATEDELNEAGVTVRKEDLPELTETHTTSSGREYAVIHSAKLPRMREIIDQADRSVLIAYYYTCDRDIIINDLRAHGYDARVFDGTKSMYEAWNKGEVPIMVIHPGSAGHGLNFQDGGHTLIWYTLPPGHLEYYSQTNKRLHRVGQTHDVHIHQLLMKKTVDTKLPVELGIKEATEKSLLDAVSKTAEEILFGDHSPKE